MKANSLLFYLTFACSSFALPCDIPAPYQSLCNYKPINIAAPNDTFGFATERIDAYLDGTTRFPAQELLGFALAGNTDAMKRLADAFENKDWSDYWWKKIYETRGINKPIPPLQLKKMPLSDQEIYKNKQSVAIKEMLKKADNQYIKDKLNCWLAQYDKSISMEELAIGGSECAIMSLSRKDILRANELKQQGQPYQINYSLEKILSLSDSVYAYERAIDCYSWRNQEPSGIPTVCENTKPDRVKVLQYTDLYVQAYASQLASKSTKNINYTLNANNTKFNKLRDRARDILWIGYKKNNQDMIEDAIFYYKEALKVPIKSTMSKDILLHELAIVLDPASKIYSKASMKKVIELFYPDVNLPLNNRKRCIAYGGYSDNSCGKLFRYLTQIKPFLFDSKQSYSFDFSSNDMYKNFPSTFKEEYIRHIKNMSGREKELNKLGLYTYTDIKEKDWSELGDKQAIEEKSARIEKMDFEGAIVAIRDSYYRSGDEILERFQKSKQINDQYLKLDVSKLDPAKYHFDKLYLKYIANGIEPLSLILKNNKNSIKLSDFRDNRIDDYKIEMDFTPSLKQKFQNLRPFEENCYGAKDDEMFAECNVHFIFDKTKIVQMDEYKKAKENGSIYALIADGTLKPKTIIRDNEKNEFMGLERYWIYSPNILGHFNGGYFITSNTDYKSKFNFLWLIEALDKYQIKHNIELFYGNERPSSIYIKNFPKELEH
ncbi:MAG: hypothetical protein PHX44_04140 [Sulfurimonas sp.]|uniref:hypothetical protein n=1 Tax=Sulfurimonas sp. TaxID=2022749 RepID=UPI002626E8EB|nr:hypothetical protein [Sulfurimonas sp.]MDD2652222.1 hypothetical protein [Sulfurimonas sp.]MDD3450496.1 hypothetical protein [Sulfurimonas sp.]